MLSRVVSALVVVVLAAALLIASWPQLFGLERTIWVAQAVSLRGLDIAIALVAIVLLLLISMASRGFRRFGMTVAVVFLVFCLGGVAVLSLRGFGDNTIEAKSAKDLTVVEWNTLGGAPGSAAIARLAIENDADIVSLPETNEQTATAIAAAMEIAGHPMTVHTVAFNNIAQAKSTSVLTSAALGAYHVDKKIGSTSTVPTLVLRPDSGKGPVIVGVHVVSPQPDDLRDWEADLLFLKKTCSDPNVIMAGDFNATLDHFAGLGNSASSAIANCFDAAAATKNAAVGTWPATLPALLGAPIDHVLATANWRFSGMRVLQGFDGAGSDHRPIVVQLSPIS